MKMFSLVGQKVALHPLQAIHAEALVAAAADGDLWSGLSNVPCAKTISAYVETALARSWQDTFVIAEARYQMFRFAFEDLLWLRVQIQADALNLQSRVALRKLGLTEEGIMRGGRVRLGDLFGHRYGVAAGAPES